MTVSVTLLRNVGLSIIDQEPDNRLREEGTQQHTLFWWVNVPCIQIKVFFSPAFADVHHQNGFHM